MLAAALQAQRTAYPATHTFNFNGCPSIELTYEENYKMERLYRLVALALNASTVELSYEGKTIPSKDLVRKWTQIEGSIQVKLPS